jgi:hypothetical protein
MSSAFHPQSDGQSEAANKVIVMYLHCLTGDRPKQWLRWLPWAEYCFNTAFHSALKTTPFKLMYGRDPPSMVAYECGDARAPAVDQMLQERDSLQDARERLLQAQEQAKLFYDAKHTSMAFGVGDWVWLKLLHRPVASLPAQTKASWHHGTTGHSRSWTTLVLWHTVWSCPRERVFTMFFMWGYSRHSLAFRHL